MKNLLIASLLLVASACVASEEEVAQPGSDEITEGGAAGEVGFPTSKKADTTHEFLNCRWRVECRYDFETHREECCERCYSDSGQLLATGACTLRIAPPRSNM